MIQYSVLAYVTLRCLRSHHSSIRLRINIPPTATVTLVLKRSDISNGAHTGYADIRVNNLGLAPKIPGVARRCGGGDVVGRQRLIRRRHTRPLFGYLHTSRANIFNPVNLSDQSLSVTPQFAQQLPIKPYHLKHNCRSLSNIFLTSLFITIISFALDGTPFDMCYFCRRTLYQRSTRIHIAYQLLSEDDKAADAQIRHVAKTSTNSF